MASGDTDSSQTQTDAEYWCAKTGITEKSTRTQSADPQLRTNTSKQTEKDNHLLTCDSLSGERRDVKYCKFQEYDFDHDHKFQEGWTQLSTRVEQSEKHCLRAKLFFYSKHFEPVNYEEYTKWKKDKDQRNTSDTRATEPPTKGDNSCNPVAQGDQATAGQELDSVSLTLSEIAELVQSGQSIPGLKTVDVHPSDADPSPSVLQRKGKPWES